MDRCWTRCCLILALIVCTGSTPTSADWPQYRGPDSRGALAQGLPAGEGRLGFEQRWVRELGGGYSGVTVQGDVVVAMFAADGFDHVAAFSATTGKELWRYELEPTYKGHDGSHDGPIATPLISAGRVFALGAGGRMAALDIASGDEVWAIHLVTDLKTEKPWYGYGSSPLAVDGNVIVGAAGGEDGTLLALDQATGALAWQSGTDAINYQSPILVSLDGSEQVLMGGEATVFAVAPETGELLWSYEHGGGGARGAASLTVLPVGDNRFFIDHADRLSALLQIERSETGWTADKVWEGKALINSYIPPVEAEGALIGYSTRFLSAVDQATGETLFRSREPGDGFPLLIEDQLVILTKAGSLHLGPVSTEGWSESASLELFDSHAWTPPAYANGSLYLRSFGQLARVDLVRGAEGTGEARSELPPRIAAILEAEDPMAAADRLIAASQPPWIDGDRITFIWRGEAEDVGIGGDMIGVRAEEAMQRIPGSDVWWFAATVPPASRLNYAFLVDFGDASLDPHNPRSIQSTLYGPDMNIARPDSTEMSWIGMPGWDEPTHYQPPPADHPRGRVAEFEVSFQPPPREEGDEAPEPMPIPVAVWMPPGYDESDSNYPVAYVLDGKARTIGGWTHTLDRLVGKRFASAVVVFVDLPRLPPPLAARALREAVVARVEADYKVSSERSQRALVGAGGSGLGALTMAFAQPDFARRIAIQSFHGIEVTIAPLKALLAEVGDDKPDFDIYFEWGALDFRAIKEGWDMRQAARDMFEELQDRGYQVNGGEVVDSTDWASWRNRTDVVLSNLFPLGEDEAKASASSR